ncbi:MAG: subtilisin family serine protease/chitodextrinase [Neolewinella sp.]|jgi:subtilisin family serine protease/chitodextrinase
MAQNNKYYWADNGQVALTPSAQQFIITADDATTLTSVKPDQVKQYQSWPHKPYAVVDMTSKMTAEQVVIALGFDTDEVQVSPGYAQADGFVMYPTRTIVAKLNDKLDADKMQLMVQRFGLKSIVKKFGTYRMELNNLDQAFAAANALQESGMVQFAQPDFYAPIQRFQDPLFAEQFQMNNTGQTIDGIAGGNDADCNALEAWGITLGSSSVTVAVIDDGLEAHEDLVDGSGNSRYTAGFSPANNGNGDAVTGSAHGVSCAGSIAASHNGIGVMGVAPLVNLISVNIFVGGESTQDLSDAFTWAKNQGADVMSNSWGYGSCTLSFSNINAAMSDANDNGRGGLGCVVTFASGNDYNSCVSYPGDYIDVIAVGAFANTGVRSAYSNYGPALDIVAPSNNVGGPGAGVRTTDRMGSAGYGSGNYTNTFGGTSSACPVVSGVAALVLGYDASLTSTEVKNLLYSTALTSNGMSDGNQYGAGRVNALGAIQALNGGGGGPTCTDGIQNGQETGVDCGGPDCTACPPTSCNGTETTLTITFDNYPEETSWTLTNDAGAVVESGGTYGGQADGSTLSIDLCLADDCYTFNITDAYGDGICCAYGNGSYSLSQGGTTLASGGSFTSNEATDFCVGGTPADTAAPSTPLNLATSNATDASIDLNWSASSDNVGVTGYNVFQGGTLLGTTTGTSASITGLTACTSYSFTVSAFDAAGNTSAQSNSASGTTTGCAGDTAAPSTPLNLATSNATDASIDLSWSASSDNVAVTGYNVYQDGALLGTVTGAGASVTGLTACTSYSFTVSAFDAAGNTSAQSNSAVGTTTGCTSGGNGFTEGYFFESGLQGWADGGSDCARVSSTRSFEGSFSVRLRDNSGTASSMTSPSYDLAGLASVTIDFFFYPNSMENGEDFWVRYNDGSGWQTVATYARGTSFDNGQFYSASVTLDAGAYSLTDGAQFRFQNDASGNNDQIYIDQVTVTGNEVAGANAAGVISTIELIPTTRRFDDVTDIGEADVQIAPNPASDVVTIRVHDPMSRITVYSIDGKQVFSRSYDGVEQTTIDVSSLPSGIYILSVQTDEELVTERMVIRR